VCLVAPRLATAGRARGFPASKQRVERLMRENGIRARHKKRYKVTMDSKHKLPVAENLLERNFRRRRIGCSLRISRTSGPTRAGCIWAGSLQPRSCRLVDQAAHDGGHRDRRADDDVAPTSA
jgi:transposase InsO family protein